MSTMPETPPEAAVHLDAVWRRFTQERSDALRNRLLLAYLPNVRFMAARIHARLPAGVEMDDLVQAGTLGLMDALESFDPGRGVKFETYSTPRIRGAILDELRSADWMPRPVRSRAKRLSEAVQQLEMELGRTPTEQEIHDRLKLPTREYCRTIADGRTGSPVSLSTLSGDPDHDGPNHDSELLDNHRDTDPSLSMMREDLKRLLTEGLSRAERLIMVMYHYEGYTLREIGRVLDLSECRVCQIHTAVVQRLRQRMGRRVPELLMAG